MQRWDREKYHTARLPLHLLLKRMLVAKTTTTETMTRRCLCLLTLHTPSLLPSPLLLLNQALLTPLRAAGLLGTSSFSTGNPLFRPRMVPVLDMAVCLCVWGGEREDENVLCVWGRAAVVEEEGGKEGRPCLEHDAFRIHPFIFPPRRRTINVPLSYVRVRGGPPCPCKVRKGGHGM